MKLLESRKQKYILYVTSVLVIYMPLHVLISQSASLLTGGLEVWKAGKDVLVFALAPPLLYAAYKKGLHKDRTFQLLLGLGALYALLHGLYILFDKNDDTGSALVGTVFNTRLLAYLLLGYVTGAAAFGKRYAKIITTAALLVAGAVALFGVLQYFLPHDLLTHVGYTLDRGVKPLFYIDDKPDLPRVMSTLKDPNSLGAYLILPLLMSIWAFVQPKVNKAIFIRPLRREVLGAIAILCAVCLFLTFSRGALIALLCSVVTILYIVSGGSAYRWAQKYKIILLGLVVIVGFVAAKLSNTYLVQNLVFHADQSTVLADPNELRVQILRNVSREVEHHPLGHGPGSAGLVSISNPKGTVLTEDYYLQIAYEVGWLGVALFLAILGLLAWQLYKNRTDPLAAVLLAALVGCAFYSLLIHLWSNEAVALQWWLLTGICLGSKYKQAN